MKLIVGLGNPGKEYEKTRHNVGFLITESFIEDNKWSKNEYAEYIKGDLEGNKFIFIKPTTFMNLSGQAVSYFMKYYKINPEDVLVIHDDLDLESGLFKLKQNSSSGGHNGIQSIIDSIGTNSFLRLKVGISKPKNGDTAVFVLKNIPKKEITMLEENQKIFNEILIEFITGVNADGLMNKYN